MTAAMLIDQGAATPDHRHRRAQCLPHPGGRGGARRVLPPDLNLTLTGVLQMSSNIGISILGTRLSPAVRYDYMRKFGLGEKTAVDFQGETPGILHKTWDSQTKYNVTYGQGVSASDAQVIDIYQTLANGGMRLPLTLVESCTKPDGTVGDAGATGRRSGGVRAGGEDHRQHAGERRHARRAGPAAANSRLPGGGEEWNRRGPGPRRVHGRAGRLGGRASLRRTNPEYVVLVSYVKPRIMKTSAAAAPTFRKIMTQVLKTHRVPPSTTPSTSPPATW